MGTKIRSLGLKFQNVFSRRRTNNIFVVSRNLKLMKKEMGKQRAKDNTENFKECATKKDNYKGKKYFSLLQ